jgi:hypothetical protein
MDNNHSGSYTRCKFKCESVSYYESGSSIILKPVIQGSLENQDFYRYTPAGELKLELVRTEATKQFIPGREYYIDITPAD